MWNHDIPSEVQNMWTCENYLRNAYTCIFKVKYVLIISYLWNKVDHWLCDCWVRIRGWARALTVNDNPKSDLDMRYRAAVSDSEACLMPKLAWYRLALNSSSICVCVFMCAVGQRQIKYCNHHLLPYESCCSPGGEMVHGSSFHLLCSGVLGCVWVDPRKGWR